MYIHEQRPKEKLLKEKKKGKKRINYRRRKIAKMSCLAKNERFFLPKISRLLKIQVS